jgi:rhodanese-related sulfurtransferase
MRKMQRMLHIGGSAVFTALLVSGCMSGAALGLVHEPLDGFRSYGKIGPDEAAAVILALQDDARFVLLDIRTPEEVETEHLPGAVNLDSRSAGFENELATLDRELIYLIYCRTANRTGQAFDLMTQMGFTKIYDLQGGILLWRELGHPICEGPLGEGHLCVGEYPVPPAGV